EAREAPRDQRSARGGPRTARRDTDHGETLESQSVGKLSDVGGPAADREIRPHIRATESGAVNRDQPDGDRPRRILMRVRRPDTRARTAVDEDDRRALRVPPLPEADGAAIQKPHRTLSRRLAEGRPHRTQFRIAAGRAPPPGQPRRALRPPAPRA